MDRGVRRLLALAAIYEGASGTEAAKIGGVTLQINRDWVLKFNAHGPDSAAQCSQFCPEWCRLWRATQDETANTYIIEITV